MNNPSINFLLTVSNEDVPPSTILLVRVIALNVFNYEPGLLGFAYLHLFYKDNGEPVEGDG